MQHPQAIRPDEPALFNPEKMGKATLFQSERLVVLAILAPGPGGA